MPWGKRRATRTSRRKTTWKPRRNRATPKTRSVSNFKSKYNSLSAPRNSIFGKQYFAKLKYQTMIELNIVSSVMAQWTFAINNLYDPDNTGVGEQPLYYDTLLGPSNTASPFSNYRVCGCKAKIMFINDNTSGTSTGAIFVHWRYGGAGTLDTLSELGTQPNTIVRDINTAGASNGIKPIKAYVSMKKMMGIKDLKDDDNTAAAYNSGPAKIVYMDVGYQPYGSAVTTTIFVRCKFTFYVQFFSQNEILESS